jgi:hypothetical protein
MTTTITHDEPTESCFITYFATSDQLPAHLLGELWYIAITDPHYCWTHTISGWEWTTSNDFVRVHFPVTHYTANATAFLPHDIIVSVLDVPAIMQRAGEWYMAEYIAYFDGIMATDD